MESNISRTTGSELTNDPNSPLKSSSNNGKITRWRNLTAFWLLGLCNNFGYVVMLSAAHDILSNNFKTDHHQNDVPILSINDTKRDCNYVSTGAILLADILPSLLIKLLAPFLPYHVNIRMVFMILLSASGFLLVAFSTVEWMAILGVVSTSLASGLGEVTLLSHSTYYDKNVISTWSSGTGGAGIFGSISYAGLIGLGMTPVNAILVMLAVPALMGITFWCVLGKAGNQSYIYDTIIIKPSITEMESSAPSATLTNFSEKLHKVPSLFVYMIPLCAVYFLEYFINQGLFELIEYRGIWLNHAQQYRWLQVDYQIGVFLSRSSVNLVTFRRIWILAFFQLVNVILFTMDVIFFIFPSIWIIFFLTLWEGLLGGAAYVNTFYRMSKEIPYGEREFSMGITSLADAIGIALAGIVSIPVHNALCALPRP